MANDICTVNNKKRVGMETENIWGEGGRGGEKLADKLGKSNLDIITQFTSGVNKWTKNPPKTAVKQNVWILQRLSGLFKMLLTSYEW